MPPSFPVLLFSTLIIILLCNAAAIVRAQVPANNTFKLINNDQFSDYASEYGAYYRFMPNPLSSHDPFINYNPFFSYPFGLYYYNTTPGEFVLGIKAGIPRDEDTMRWVWDANRNHPVKENATLSFGRDGNLVLADVDGTVAWQTNTANKGVTGVRLLNTGNLVLFDKQGKFVWQSFDHPVDTLLAGMSLGINGSTVKKLVSRTSDENGRDGKYSLVLDDKSFGLYLNASGKNILYNGWLGTDPDLIGVEFRTAPIDTEPKSSGWELLLEFFRRTPPQNRRLLQSRPSSSGNALILKKLNYNTSISFLRLESDGNVKAYTYFTDVPYLKWAETYSFFTDDVRECGRPEKCGALGLCDRGMCVACPTQKGLRGWSETCAPPKLKPCAAKAKVDYFKIDATEHFLNVESVNGDGEGPTGFELCRDKCSRDCECKAFVYKTNTKKCLRVPVLGTFIKDVNTSTAYIKYSL